MEQLPVTQERAVMLVDVLKKASLAYQKDPTNKNLVALCDARNAVVRAKNIMKKYSQACHLSQVAHASYIVGTLEQAIDKIIA